jgi:hypothetical protein
MARMIFRFPYILNPLKTELALLTDFKDIGSFQFVIQNMLGEQVFQFREDQADGIYSIPEFLI